MGEIPLSYPIGGHAKQQPTKYYTSKMTPPIRFNQFINNIVIGVLFQFILLLLFYSVSYINPLNFIDKDNSTIVVAAAIILSFPLSRMVSNFVGFILEPVSDNPKLIKNRYIKIFYGINVEKVEGRVQLLKKIATSNSDYYKKQKSILETYFNQSLDHRTDEELYNLFEIIKATLYVKPSEFQGHHSEQHNQVSNFHARLSVLSNFGFWFTVTGLLFGLVTTIFFPWYFYALALVCFFGLGRHFGINTDTKSEGYRLMLADFFAINLIAKNEKAEK